MDYPYTLPEPMLNSFDIVRGPGFIKSNLIYKHRAIPKTNDMIAVTFNFSYSELQEFNTFINDINQIDEFQASWSIYEDYIFRFVSSPIITKLINNIYEVKMNVIVIRKQFIPPNIILTSMQDDTTDIEFDNPITVTINDVETTYTESPLQISVSQNDTIYISFVKGTMVRMSHNDWIKTAVINQDIKGIFLLMDCDNLETVEVNATILDANGSFRDCAKLKTVYVEKLTYRMYRTFVNSDLLETATFGSTQGLTRMDYAFANCTSLKCVPVIDSVGSDYNSTIFENCDSLITPDASTVDLIQSSSGYDFTGTCT